MIKKYKKIILNKRKRKFSKFSQFLFGTQCLAGSGLIIMVSNWVGKNLNFLK